jgi:hypothetical protein
LSSLIEFSGHQQAVDRRSGREPRAHGPEGLQIAQKILSLFRR